MVVYLGNSVTYRIFFFFTLNIKSYFFTVRVTEHWHRLPREIVKSPSMEILRSHLEMVLGNNL